MKRTSAIQLCTAVYDNDYIFWNGGIFKKLALIVDTPQPKSCCWTSTYFKVVYLVVLDEFPLPIGLQKKVKSPFFTFFQVIFLPMIPFFLPVVHMALMGSVYSTVIMSLERYLRLCKVKVSRSCLNVKYIFVKYVANLKHAPVSKIYCISN